MHAREGIQRWRDFWTALIERQRAENGRLGRSSPGQSDVAKRLRRDPSELSRLITQCQCPKNQKLIVDVGKLFGASDEEIRALLVLHQIVRAERAGHADLAAHYRAMFRPVYGERNFLSGINPLPNIVFQVLRETGASRDEAEDLTTSVASTLDHVQGGILEHFATIVQREEFKPLATAVSGLNLAQLKSIAEKHARILTVDVALPWGRRMWQRQRRRPERGGDRGHSAKPYRLRHQESEVGHVDYWDVIPYVAITRVEIHPNKRLTDHAHSGVEFAAILEGKGVFAMEGVGTIELDPKDRNLIGYQPAAEHSFTASEAGATILVIEYQGPSTQGRDPIDDLIARAQRQAGMRPTPAQANEPVTV